MGAWTSLSQGRVRSRGDEQALGGQAKTIAQVGEFFIYPEFRREGMGRRMAEALLEWFKANGAVEIQSGRRRGQLRGLRFWEAMGFQIARYALRTAPIDPASRMRKKKKKRKSTARRCPEFAGC